MARPNPAIDLHGSPSFPGGATIDQDGTLELRTRLFHNIARKYIAGYREGVKGTERREKGTGINSSQGSQFQNQVPSPNDLVSPVQHGLWDRQADLLRGL